MESIDTLKESSDRSLRRAVDDHTIATRDKRVYNAFLDGILITVLLYLVNKLFPAGLPSDAPFSIYKTTLSAVAVFLYYFVFELLYHKTPAKFVTKTKVVSEDGAR